MSKQTLSFLCQSLCFNFIPVLKGPYNGPYNHCEFLNIKLTTTGKMFVVLDFPHKLNVSCLRQLNNALLIQNIPTMGTSPSLGLEDKSYLEKCSISLSLIDLYFQKREIEGVKRKIIVSKTYNSK